MLSAATAVACAQSLLPELGDSSGALVTSQQERKVGAEGMRELRASGAYLQDPEVNAYLNELGPVSYTHLDVYKRQLPPRALAHPPHGNEHQHKNG